MREFSDLIAKAKIPKKAPAPPPEAEVPSEAPVKAHPDQLDPDVPGPLPDFSPENTEPFINQWLHCGEMNICQVDGAFVRDHIHIDYVEGGHFFRYSWIPPDQIWIEDILARIDQCSTAVHECHEHFLMSNGMSYDDAHDDSSKRERAFRNLALQAGTVLPDDDEMEQILLLELNGADCLSLAKEIMEGSDNSVTRWIKETGKSNAE